MLQKSSAILAAVVCVTVGQEGSVSRPTGWPAGLLATPTGTCGATQLNNVGANFLFAINFHPTANIQNLHR